MNLVAQLIAIIDPLCNGFIALATEACHLLADNAFHLRHLTAINAADASHQIRLQLCEMVLALRLAGSHFIGALGHLRSLLLGASLRQSDGVLDAFVVLCERSSSAGWVLAAVREEIVVVAELEILAHLAKL